MNEAEIRALVGDLLAAWDRRDLDAFTDLLADDVSWSDPAMLYGPAVGKVEVRAFAENVLKAFPDFSFEIREPICISASGDRFALPWVITATHTERFDPLGFAPTNQRIGMQGVDLIDLAGGRIKNIQTLFDVIPAAEQALRLKPFPRKGLRKCLIVSIQRACAWWLRRTTPRPA